MASRLRWVGFVAVAAFVAMSSVASAQMWRKSGTTKVVIESGAAVIQLTAKNGAPVGQEAGGYSWWPQTPITFGDITKISVEYKANMTGGGAPRLSIQFGTPAASTGNVVYRMGPLPEFSTNVPFDWTATGDIIDLSATEARWENQWGGGQTWVPFSTVAANIPANRPIRQIFIVNDFAPSPAQDKVVTVRNFTIEAAGQTYVGNGRFVVDTRNVDTIFNLNNAVAGAHSSAGTLPAGNPYVDLGKTAEGQAYTAHTNAALVTYFNETDFPAALSAYKQLRYQQATYHGRAAQYFAYGGSPANGSPRTFSLNAKNIGTFDFNAP